MPSTLEGAQPMDSCPRLALPMLPSLDEILSVHLLFWGEHKENR